VLVFAAPREYPAHRVHVRVSGQRRRRGDIRILRRTQGARRGIREEVEMVVAVLTLLQAGAYPVDLAFDWRRDEGLGYAGATGGRFPHGVW